MSDNVAMLLVKGIAFAKEGNKEEARAFLEWALAEYPDFDQQVKAYLWLSRIEEDPDKRRSYLEEALALDLGNPELRQELAILQGRLKTEEIIDPSRPVNPLQPAAEIAPGQVRQFVCPNCAGQMAYDPDAGALVCGQCGHRTAQPEAGGVREQEFLAAALTARGHRWELPAERTLQCSGCGATFTLPAGRLSGACPFCGSVKVVATTTTQDLLQPEGVAPFQFQQFRAIAVARRWLAEQRFRPGDLDQQATFSRPRPVYLPFWSFDLGGTVKWSATVKEPGGTAGDYDIISGRSDDQIEGLLANALGAAAEHTVKIRRSDSYPVAQYDVLVPGSRSLRADLLSQLAPSYDLKELRPYSPDLLAGWPAEVYGVSLTDASLDARERALDEAKEGIRLSILRETGSRDVEDLVWDSSGMAVYAFKLVLLPVWSMDYAYKGARYSIVINGQTGAVFGDIPRSGWQKALGGLLGST